MKRNERNERDRSPTFSESAVQSAHSKFGEATMMSLHDMFYGSAEPVFIVKPPSAEEKKKQAEEKKKEEYSILKLIPDYPYYYADTPAPPPAPAKKDDKKEKKVTLKVDICCEDCVEIITSAVKKVKGVKDVDCNIRKERVVVTCAPDTAPADVILAARKEFRHAKLDDN
ncbi:hypothetical protein R1sor_022306 [Riccia sorocarpa]|uniref:HMA domain-containing protein n=1 Tax=Riccia sorocarpa TaxID=122646 RepID=A0ABD3GJG7_9MARC